MVPCKRRDCSTCGPAGRHRIARRIAFGVRQLWPAAWQVLTFTEDIEKKAAVRHLATYVKWLRTLPGLEKMQYVATYELTENGRLHINLICAPWVFVRQSVLQAQWGAIVWVEWVKDSISMSHEAAADYSPESLGGYLAKLEQCVPLDRRVSYSKGWPKMPKEGGFKGKIKWLPLSPDDREQLKTYLRLNMFEELRPGEYRLRPIFQDVEPCDCFEVQLPLPNPPPVFPPHGPPLTL